MSDLADTQSGQISLAKSYGDEETRLQGKLDGTLTGLEEEEVKATAEVDALQQAFVEAFSGIEEATTKDVPRFVVPFVVVVRIILECKPFGYRFFNRASKILKAITGNVT